MLEVLFSFETNQQNFVHLFGERAVFFDVVKNALCALATHDRFALEVAVRVVLCRWVFLRLGVLFTTRAGQKREQECGIEVCSCFHRYLPGVLGQEVAVFSFKMLVSRCGSLLDRSEGCF